MDWTNELVCSFAGKIDKKYVPKLQASGIDGRTFFMASPETFLDDPFNFTMEEVSALLNARKEVKEAFKLESRNIPIKQKDEDEESPYRISRSSVSYQKLQSMIKKGNSSRAADALTIRRTRKKQVEDEDKENFEIDLSVPEFSEKTASQEKHGLTSPIVPIASDEPKTDDSISVSPRPNTPPSSPLSVPRSPQLAPNSASSQPPRLTQPKNKVYLPTPAGSENGRASSLSTGLTITKQGITSSENPNRASPKQEPSTGSQQLPSPMNIGESTSAKGSIEPLPKFSSEKGQGAKSKDSKSSSKETSTAEISGQLRHKHSRHKHVIAHEAEEITFSLNDETQKKKSGNRDNTSQPSPKIISTNQTDSSPGAKMRKNDGHLKSHRSQSLIQRQHPTSIELVEEEKEGHHHHDSLNANEEKHRNHSLLKNEKHLSGSVKGDADTKKEKKERSKSKELHKSSENTPKEKKHDSKGKLGETRKSYSSVCSTTSSLTESLKPSQKVCSSSSPALRDSKNESKSWFWQKQKKSLIPPPPPTGICPTPFSRYLELLEQGEFDYWSSFSQPIEDWNACPHVSKRRQLVNLDCLKSPYLYTLEMSNSATMNESDQRYNFYITEADLDYPIFAKSLEGVEPKHVKTYVYASAMNPIIVSVITRGSLKRVIYRTKERDIRVLRSAQAKDTFDDLNSRLPKNAKFTEIRAYSVNEDLKVFESMLTVKHYKFGLIFADKFQHTENEFYSNKKGSPAFEEFLDMIGRVKLQGYKGYRGGLDVNNNSTGEYSVAVSDFKSYDIMFHVSTLLPYQEFDEQKVERKRHIGNDVVVLIFKERGDETDTFDPRVVTSHFNSVFFIVSPTKRHGETYYILNILNRPGIDPYPPYFKSSSPIFAKHEFLEFLLTKMINAERSAMHSGEFVVNYKNTRAAHLLNICNKFKK